MCRHKLIITYKWCLLAARGARAFDENRPKKAPVRGYCVRAGFLWQCWDFGALGVAGSESRAREALALLPEAP